jgi:ElaB/YqjD/DUF883 family membrane-anchored ribosome-binding protein
MSLDIFDDKTSSDIQYLQENVKVLSNMYYTVQKIGIVEYKKPFTFRDSTLGLESLPVVQSDSLALESIKSSVISNLAKWSAKVLTVIKGTVSSIANQFNPFLNKLKEKIALLKKGTYSKAKASKEYIKAHPYKVAIIAITTIIALFGIVGFATGSFPIATTRVAVTEYMTSLSSKISKLNSPLMKVKTTVLNGSSVKAEIIGTIPDVASKTAKDLGWTQSNSESLINQTQSMMDKMNSNWKAFENNSVSKTKHMESSIASLLGRESYNDDFEETDLLDIFLKVIKTIYYTAKAILVICFEVLKSVFGTLSWLYTSSNSIKV